MPVKMYNGRFFLKNAESQKMLSTVDPTGIFDNTPMVRSFLRLAKIRPIRTPFPFPIFRQMQENPANLPFSVPVENKPYNRPVS
jgi:hypothetical protein